MCRNCLGRAGARALFAAFALLIVRDPATAQQAIPWEVHDPARPHPPLVEPAPDQGPTRPPEDAIVLFDGSGLSHWEGEDGGAARWTVEDGAMRIVEGTGSIRSRETFGDVQLHVEWMTANSDIDPTRYRGNSGVYLMGLYEVQVLDSYRDGVEIYADGQAAAMYGQHAPLVNASRPPGEWQTFDIVFRRPRFSASGRLAEPARITVFHNGVLVQDAVELTGPTEHQRRPPYEAHPDRLPLMLQNHGSPVRFRNIWIRQLDESAR